ncbi:polyprotein [Clonorchis sinensis]|uniref:Polyprotein n=1 Tax=Clonorchis sinensis TaxID=79923 RepID=G7YAJ0_CLOSI|nr:polyprotein [Clonorchis sinensis]
MNCTYTDKQMPHRPHGSIINRVVLLAAYSKSACHPAPASSGVWKSIFKLRHPVYLAAFNARTLKQAGQQAALALSLHSLGFDVCCVSEQEFKMQAQ